MIKKPKKAGRPTKKQHNTVEKILHLVKENKTNVEIAEMLKVSEGTVRYWINQEIDLFTTVQELRCKGNNVMQGSLFKRGNGYDVIDYEDVKIDGEVVRLEKKRHIPGDVTAMKFWLINMMKEKYREKVDHSHSDPDGNPLTLVIKDFRNEDDK